MKEEKDIISTALYQAEVGKMVLDYVGRLHPTIIQDAMERRAVRILEDLGCTVRPGQMGLFEWGRLPERVLAAGTDCYGFIDRILEEKKVFLTPGGIFGSEGERYVRVSLCADEATLQEAWARLFK